MEKVLRSFVEAFLLAALQFMWLVLGLVLGVVWAITLFWAISLFGVAAYMWL